MVPKPDSRWRPFLDLSKPNLSETIRTSLQQGEWFTSIDFKDAYFHKLIQEQSRKYLRIHIQGRACVQSAMVESGGIHLPTISHIGQSGGEVAGLPMQENHSDCSGVAQHALVLGSSGHVQPNPTEPAQSAQPVDTTIQSDPSQKSDKS